MWLKKDVDRRQRVDIVTDFEVGDDISTCSDFAKSGQAWDKVVRLGQDRRRRDGAGQGHGVWIDVALLAGHRSSSVGADQHQMSLADLGLIV